MQANIFQGLCFTMFMNVREAAHGRAETWSSSWKGRAASSASTLKATHWTVTLKRLQHETWVSALPPGGQPGCLIINGCTPA